MKLILYLGVEANPIPKKKLQRVGNIFTNGIGVVQEFYIRVNNLLHEVRKIHVGNARAGKFVVVERTSGASRYEEAR